MRTLLMCLLVPAGLAVAQDNPFSAFNKDAFAYDGMTDAAATQTVKLLGGDMPKPIVLTVNDMHLSEHYGNLVTYMRLKNIVPPGSEQGSQP